MIDLTKTLREVEEENLALWKKRREEKLEIGGVKVTRQIALDFLENEGWLDGQEYETLQEYAKALEKKRSPTLEPVNYHKSDLLNNSGE